MIWIYVKFILIGFVEYFITTLNVKFIQKNKDYLAVVTTISLVFIWKFVILSLPEINKSGVFNAYALSLGFACWCALRFDRFLETVAKSRGIKFKRKMHKFASQFYK